MSDTNRRTVVLRLVALAFLLGFMGSIGSTRVVAQPAPIKFEYLNSPGITQNFHIWVAKEKGFFAQEGIDTTTIDTTAAVGTQLTAVASGSASAMFGGLATVFEARQKGIKVRFVGGVVYSDRAASIKKGRENELPVAKSAADLPRTLRALKGKVLGIPGLGTSSQFEFGGLLREAGLDPDKDVSWVQVAPGPPAEAAISRGTVDVVWGSLNSGELMEADGVATTLFTAQGSGPAGYKNLIITGPVVTDKFLSDHPDFDRRYQRAIDKAIDYVKDPKHIDEVVGIVQKYGIKAYPGLKANLMGLRLVKTVDPRIVQSGIDWGVANNVLGSQVKLGVSDLFSPSAMGKT